MDNIPQELLEKFPITKFWRPPKPDCNQCQGKGWFSKDDIDHLYIRRSRIVRL